MFKSGDAMIYMAEQAEAAARPQVIDFPSNLKERNNELPLIRVDSLIVD